MARAAGIFLNVDAFQPAAQSYTLIETYSLIQFPAQSHLVHAKRNIFAYSDPSLKPSMPRLNNATAITYWRVHVVFIGDEKLRRGVCQARGLVFIGGL
jgi:hypothetical protein